MQWACRAQQLLNSKFTLKPATSKIKARLERKIPLRQAVAVCFLFVTVFLSLVALYYAQQAAASDADKLERRELVKSPRSHQVSLRTTAMLARVDNVIIIDTRPMSDYIAGHLAGAIMVTLREKSTIDLASLLGAIQHARTVVICGRNDDLYDLELVQKMVSGVNWNCFCCPMDRKMFLGLSPRDKEEVIVGR